MDLNEFLSSEYFKKARSIFVMSWTLPDPLVGYKGRLTFIGNSLPYKATCAKDFTCKLRDGHDEMMFALKTFAHRADCVYDFIMFDTDHKMEIIVEQINSANRFSNASTVFLFPGVAPPMRIMATPRPEHEWWVGDVWCLAHVLKSNGAVIHTSDMAPVGLLLANNVREINMDASISSRNELQSKILTDLEFSQQFEHSDLGKIKSFLTQGVADRFLAKNIEIIVDPAEPDVVQSLSIDPVEPWERSPPSFILDLSDRNIDVKFFADTSSLQHGTRVDVFADALICGRDIVLAGDRDVGPLRYYGKNWDTNVAQDTLSERVMQPGYRGDVASLFERFDEKQYIERQIIDQCEIMESPAFVCTPDEQHNFGMTLLYGVPSVRLYKEMRSSFPRFMAYSGDSWQKRFYLELGIPEEELIHQRSDRVYKVSKVATLRHHARTISLTKYDLEAFDEVAHRSVQVNEHSPDRIFVSRISRTVSGAYRGLSNEKELMVALQALGFVVIEPETLGILDQARIFHQASIIIGLGGAGMFNVAFCRPGCLVIDIESSTLFVNSHASLFASRGVRYGIIFGAIDESDPRPVQKRWTLDVDSAISAVRQICNF